MANHFFMWELLILKEFEALRPLGLWMYCFIKVLLLLRFRLCVLLFFAQCLLIHMGMVTMVNMVTMVTMVT